jgi:tuftelin-interacting protein 11
MARRKNGFLSDGSDDSDASVEAGSEDDGYNSQEDGDGRAERALFEHNGRKRRKTGGGRTGKDQAWEGIFGEDEDSGRAGGRGLGAKRGGRGGKSAGGRTDWTKYVDHKELKGGLDADCDRAPTFVTKSKDEGAEAPKDESMDQSEEDGDSEDSGEDDEDESRAASPRIREDDDDQDDAPRTGMGLGSRAPPRPTTSEEEPKSKKGGRGGIGSASRGRGGIGSTGRSGMPSFAPAGSVPESGDSTPSASSPHPGLGMSDAPGHPMEEETPAQSAPEPRTSFGRPPPSSLTESSEPSSRPRQSFMGRQAAPAAVTAAPLTAQEKAHFSSISNSFGARLLAKQGWQAGKGLGAAEDGRAVPIAAGVHLKGTGIRAGVRTEDSKREARRNGQTFSDDEEEEEMARRRGKGKGKKGGQGAGQQQAGQGRQEPKEDSWKKQRKVKVRIEHKTYEQLVAEAADGAASGVGLVLDARGGDLKEVHSMSNLSLSSWTPTSDATQLPELRHNLRLIVDIAKGDVEALAREGKSVNERRKWAVREEQIARQKIDETEQRITRLTAVQALVQTISILASGQSMQTHPSLLPLSESFNTLLDEYKAEYASEQLHEVVVGAIAQVMRRPFADWEPFDPSSDILLSSLKTWKRAYNLGTNDGSDRANGSSSGGANRQMTAWESLIWTLWLPKVRSTINNDWDALHPRAAIHLIESWESILPAFIRDNIIDQLILPKVRKAVDEWDARKQSVSLYKIVWPWFPVLGERMDEVLEGAKRRIRSVLRHWVVKDGIPKELSRWKKDIYSSSEWDKLVLQYVVPKLGVCLREDFAVNPANQNMVPFAEWVMPWHELLRGSMMAHLLEVEFFPKWLDTLYLWLVHPGYKPDEVANWFLWWKEQFPPPVRDSDAVQHGFKQALDLMNQAVELGSQAPQKLRKPVFQPLPHKKSKSFSTSKSKSRSSASTPVPRQLPPEQTDITFRSLAEDFAVQNDLIFMPLGRSDTKTGKPLFKVSKGVDGRKGVTVYVGESAVFAQSEDGEYRAISLDDMVKRGLS